MEPVGPEAFCDVREVLFLVVTVPVWILPL